MKVQEIKLWLGEGAFKTLETLDVCITDLVFVSGSLHP